MCNNPKLDLVNINPFIKIDENISIFSQDIEWKPTYGRRTDEQTDGQTEWQTT